MFFYFNRQINFIGSQKVEIASFIALTRNNVFSVLNSGFLSFYDDRLK